MQSALLVGLAPQLTLERHMDVIAALFALAVPARAADDAISPPTLRASITVSSDVVRVGDLIDNAGAAAQIPVYRSPDLGTTGALPVAQVLACCAPSR